MRPTRIEPLTLFANRALDSGELFLRRRKKCSPSLPANVPQVLDITGFLTISGRSHFLQKPLFYPSAISRKLAELILAVGHFPGSFAKISRMTDIMFLKKRHIPELSLVLLNITAAYNSTASSIIRTAGSLAIPGIDPRFVNILSCAFRYMML